MCGRKHNKKMIDEQTVQRIIESAQIVDVVQDFMTLRRRGSNYIGCCPFHNEKTPSFHCDKDKQFYHCFGCGKGGSVINFIMEIENLSFPDAVEFLARRAGMEMPNDGDRAQRDRRARLLDLNRDAARF